MSGLPWVVGYVHCCIYVILRSTFSGCIIFHRTIKRDKTVIGLIVTRYPYIIRDTRCLHNRCGLLPDVLYLGTRPPLSSYVNNWFLYRKPLTKTCSYSQNGQLMDDPGIVGSSSLRAASLYSTTISTCGNKCIYRIFSVAGCFYVEKLFTDTHFPQFTSLYTINTRCTYIHNIC